jgi:hypothetical protein
MDSDNNDLIAGCDPAAMEEMGAVYAIGALRLRESGQRLQGRVLADPPIPGARGVALNQELANSSVGRLSEVSGALGRMSAYLKERAEYQRRISSGQAGDRQPPRYARQFEVRDDPLLIRGLGGLQVLGGAFQLVAGLKATATLFGMALGLPLAAHGLDDMYTGAQTIYYGKTHKTFTELKLTELTSEEVAQTVDFLAGVVGPGLAAGVTRGAARGMRNGLILAHVPPSRADRYAHMMVGVAREGKKTVVYDARLAQENMIFWRSSTVDIGHFSGRVVNIPTSPWSAERAFRRAEALGAGLTGTQWTHFTNNCATSVNEVLRAAGAGSSKLTNWAPMLLYQSTKHPAAVSGLLAAGTNLARQYLADSPPSWLQSTLDQSSSTGSR